MANSFKVLPLKKSSDFLEITKKGIKYRVSSYLILFVFESIADDQSYFGTTVSRKVGNAVVRNKLKRWVRHCVQSEFWVKKYKSKRVVFMFKAQPEDFYKKLEFKKFISDLEQAYGKYSNNSR